MTQATQAQMLAEAAAVIETLDRILGQLDDESPEYSLGIVCARSESADLIARLQAQQPEAEAHQIPVCPDCGTAWESVCGCWEGDGKDAHLVQPVMRKADAGVMQAQPEAWFNVGAGELVDIAGDL